MIPNIATQIDDRSADSLLAELTRLGVVLSIENDKLRFRAPVGVLTAELREVIARLRDEIIRRLRLKDALALPARPYQLPARCPTHTDPRDWIDASPANGRVRTTCRRCEAFVGYRPDNANPA